MTSIAAKALAATLTRHGTTDVSTEIETAAREHVPVIAVVLDNATLGCQKHAELYQCDAHAYSPIVGGDDEAVFAA
jgi:thiamine pyrophosphate-dependent enzyme